MKNVLFLKCIFYLPFFSLIIGCGNVEGTYVSIEVGVADTLVLNGNGIYFSSLNINKNSVKFEGVWEMNGDDLFLRDWKSRGSEKKITKGLKYKNDRMYVNFDLDLFYEKIEHSK